MRTVIRRPPAGGTGSDSLGLKTTNAFTTTMSLVNPIAMTPYYVNDNEAERSPDSCSGLHSECDG